MPAPKPTTIGCSKEFRRMLRIVASLEDETQVAYLDRVVLPLIQSEIRDIVTGPNYKPPTNK